MTTLAKTKGLPPRRKLVEDGVLGMALFVFVEIMLFAGFISAFEIVSHSATGGIWPPPGQPRLPVQSTAVNTAALLLSAPLLWSAHKAWGRDGAAAAKNSFGAAIALGAFFVAFQGFEWLGLIREGLTLTSSQLGSFFYVIIGAHALHAIGALAAMGWGWWRLSQGRLDKSAFSTIQVFWYFVVLMWPILYLRVYL